MKSDAWPFQGTGAIVWRPRTDTEHAWARRAVRRGVLKKVLPCTYAPAAAPLSFDLRVTALAAVDPDAVLTGEAAARLLWWPELAADPITATRASSVKAVRGYRWEQRTIPLDLLVDHGGLRVSSPALSVLDLIPTRGGNAIDEALRRRACTLDDLWRALDLTPDRRGNRLRRILLHDSRDEPWSEAERHLHHHYRACDLPFAYATNHWVTLTDGRNTALDFALPQLRLAFEADGFSTHGSRTAFEYDRDRDSDLAAEDWWIIRLSASFLEHDPAEVRRRLTAIVRHRARALGIDSPTPPADRAYRARGCELRNTSRRCSTVTSV